jgi:O-antigen/teichoic acid export membrane protein
MAASSLKQRALNGAIWTIFGYGSSQVLRFIANLILTRLLIPEYFGVMSVVHTLRMGIELFSDIGIPHSIINNKRGDDPKFLNTAWSLQIIRGFILCAITVALAYPAAYFYRDDRFLWILPLLSLCCIFEGFISTSVHTLHRQMRWNFYTKYEFVTYVAGLIFLILWAWASPSIWAPVMGCLAGSLTHSIASHFLIPGYRNRFVWDSQAAKEIFSFGKWIMVSTIMVFMADQSDRLILGRLISFQMLGIYTVAYSFAMIPREIIKTLSYRVFFPAISEAVEQPFHELRSKIFNQRKFILLGFASFLSTLIVIGDVVIRVFYDDRYLDATWMMPILCSGVWFSVLFYTMDATLMALGKPFYAAQSNFARFLIILIGIPLAHHYAGILGVVLIIALSDVPLYCVNLYGLYQEKLFFIWQDIQMTIYFFTCLLALLLIRYVSGFGLPINSLLN